MEIVSTAGLFESFQKKTWIFLMTTVYSLAILCFSSGRVSIVHEFETEMLKTDFTACKEQTAKFTQVL